MTPLENEALGYRLATPDPFAPGGYLLRARWQHEPTACDEAETLKIVTCLEARHAQYLADNSARYERHNGITLDYGHTPRSCPPGHTCSGKPLRQNPYSDGAGSK